jgi:hypothetical protein
MSELTSVHLSTRTQSVVFRTPNKTDLLLLAPLSLARFLAIQQQSSIRNNNAKFLVSYNNLKIIILLNLNRNFKLGKRKSLLNDIFRMHIYALSSYIFLTIFLYIIFNLYSHPIPFSYFPFLNIFKLLHTVVPSLFPFTCCICSYYSK